MIDKEKQGKANRLKGARFELKVREDLKDKGWIVDKWTNNVDFCYDDCGGGEMHPARYNRFNMRSTGFPDFIAFKLYNNNTMDFYEVIAVEVKTNGYLSKEEKEKCTWYLDNNIFSKILIASNDNGEIVYKEYERGYKK